MDMDKNIQTKIDALKDLFNLLQQTVTFQIGMMWTFLGVGAAVLGWALAIIAKDFARKKVDEKLHDLDDRIIELMRRNPPYYHERGSATISANNNNFIIANLPDFSFNQLVTLEVFNRDGKELARNLIIDENQNINVKLMHYNEQEDGNVVYWQTMWKRKEYSI